MSRLKEKGNMVDRTFFGRQTQQQTTRRLRLFRDRVALPALIPVLVLALLSLGGCETEDCVNCVEALPPVVPTGVHSISGDDWVDVQWYDISYYPYDGQYNSNVVKYVIYSRYYQVGDEDIADREFVAIGEVAWDENYDGTSGLHWFRDWDAENGEEYEYAVAAVNSAGEESALSFEFVTDAPLPMGLDGVEIFGLGVDPTRAGFDFSALDAGRTDPTGLNSEADIRVYFSGGGAFVQSNQSWVKIQDFGVFMDGDRNLIFEGVSWAPADGYSNVDTCELILGHIYVLELDDPQEGLHYAKFGVVGMSPDESVEIVWAYQTIEGLPELSVPEEHSKPGAMPQTISF